ncbi:hypothetical protein L4D06_08145 [Enterovibrio makurazakiensis]|uniref:hypothetical protein n=1 Tax=Enterovibrio makurazakiensis TaxID=2910232 RepID=UPI003D213A2A
MTYRDAIKLVEKRSLELGLDPQLGLKIPIDDEKITLLQQVCCNHLIQTLLHRYQPGDWGQQCLNIAAQTFAIFQHWEIPCELVFGEVNINGTDEYGTTLEGLLAEYKHGYTENAFAIHVWVNIGKDYIIDPTISSRINKYYDPNCPQNLVINGTAKTLDRTMRLKYKPILAGVKYLERTCDIPLEYKISLA